MKYCIAVEETLRREIVVESTSFDNAIENVRSAYYNGQIVLTADDLAQLWCDEAVQITEADWYSSEEVQDMEITGLVTEEERVCAPETAAAEKDRILSDIEYAVTHGGLRVLDGDDDSLIVRNNKLGIDFGISIKQYEE